MANTKLILYHDGLQKVGAERFEVALVEYEIAYYESVGDVSPSTSISDPSINILCPSTS
jgi:hypothetical protein